MIAPFDTGQDFTSVRDSLKLNRAWKSYHIRERSRFPGCFEPEQTLRHTYSSQPRDLPREPANRIIISQEDDLEADKHMRTVIEIEREHAALAIKEARKSPGNARVGAVITRGGSILSTGFKGEIERLHAEEVALNKALDAGVELKGATLYATLEPCANSRTARVSCSELIAKAGIRTVHIGVYDPNPQVYRLGWKHLRDQGVRLRDFPSDLRLEAREVNEDFARVFTHGVGMSAGAKFDFTANGGRFTISTDEHPGASSWETQWTNCGASAIYFYGGRPGIVGLARYAHSFDEVDDPDALDYGGSSARVEIGGIAVMRNAHGHVLCKVIAIEPTHDYGGTGHVSVTIKWEIRLVDEGAAQ